MTRADLEAAAEEKYPPQEVIAAFSGRRYDMNREVRAAYIRGRLDQAEADKRTAETSARGYDVSDWDDVDEAACNRIAAAIEKGVE